MNIFPKVTAGITDSQVQYHQHLDGIQADWQDEWGYEELAAQAHAQAESLIPNNLCRKIKELLDEHRADRDPSNQPDFLFFSTFLEYEDRERVPPNYFEEWKTARKWFLKHTHLRGGSYAEDAGEEVVRHFQTLDGLLRVAASSAFERLKGINEVLDETNQ